MAADGFAAVVNAQRPVVVEIKRCTYLGNVMLP
jgi:hypothetical protein